jgi:adenylate cyclase
VSIKKISALTALGSVGLFSLLSLLPLFSGAENQVYDMFLRFRPPREQATDIVFLDVDDQAIARIGVFPWPRSVMAGGLLRLKEYGAAAAIMDIEYVDSSPAQVDDIYLRQGLRGDYNRRFAAIGARVAELLDALSAGSIRGTDVSAYAEDMMELIMAERDRLYAETMGLIRNDDEYLAQAASLFGRVWGTVNLQDVTLTGEQAERRLRAEERFSYPVATAPGLSVREAAADALPPIPLFLEAVKGAGFTNIEIDRDGTRRRLFLARRAGDSWYLQLAFAPLMDSLGNPAIELEKRRLTVRGAKLPDGTVEDIVIPLDSRGAMLLDWPRTSYQDTFTHVSFVQFFLLEACQSNCAYYLEALADIDRFLFPGIADGAEAALERLRAAGSERSRALAEQSEDAFAAYCRLRDEGMALAKGLAETGSASLGAALEGFSGGMEDGELWAALEEEAGYCALLFEYLQTELTAYADIHAYLSANLRDKICVVGRVDTGSTDIGVNPFYGEYVNVGTHGVMLDTIRSRSFIDPLPKWWSIALALLWVPAALAGISSLKPGRRILLGIMGMVLLLGFSFGLFYLKGIFLSPLAPVLAMLAALAARETIAFAHTEKERQFVRQAFSTYLSADVVQEIIADPARLRLGGARKHMTAVFTDVTKFSGIAEKLEPEDLVRLLNDYLSLMSDVMLEQRGTIDKYEGDAIIAFFGAPQEMPDHALRACVSAVTMKRLESAMNKRYEENAWSPGPLLSRIGINTGDMVVGNMGAQKKMDYTIMGNEVNLASRLEGVNKQYGTWILASESTVRETRGKILSRPLDRVRVVGIQEPVRLHEIMDIADGAPAETTALAARFAAALELFEKRNWAEAERSFAAALRFAPGDRPSQLYRNRCVTFLNNPPSEDWDGVYNLTEK